MGKSMKHSLEELISINGDEKAAEVLRKYFENNQKNPGKLLGVFVNNTKEGYELIQCSECMKKVLVEKDTWALDMGMCEPCYWARKGGR